MKKSRWKKEIFFQYLNLLLTFIIDVRYGKKDCVNFFKYYTRQVVDENGKFYEDLSFQIIADLLWAAFGVNRPESKGRTAPSAMNCQEIDIYVALETGLYLYNPFKNILELIVPHDIRAVTGKQGFVKKHH